jgi:hypothetical protein
MYDLIAAVEDSAASSSSDMDETEVKTLRRNWRWIWRNLTVVSRTQTSKAGKSAGKSKTSCMRCTKNWRFNIFIFLRVSRFFVHRGLGDATNRSVHIMGDA